MIIYESFDKDKKPEEALNRNATSDTIIIQDSHEEDDSSEEEEHEKL